LYYRLKNSLKVNFVLAPRHPSTHLPVSMIDELRQLANERDIPYQSLIKHFLRERIDQEYKVNKS
jgi:hypothetical protein